MIFILNQVYSSSKLCRRLELCLYYFKLTSINCTFMKDNNFAIYVFEEEKFPTKEFKNSRVILLINYRYSMIISSVINFRSYGIGEIKYFSS